MDLQNVSFLMPIDEVMNVNVIMVTGHIEQGSIKVDTPIAIVDGTGNAVISSIVKGIISQESIPQSQRKMIPSASEEQDDYWGIALLFDDDTVLQNAKNGMYVVVE